MFRRADVNDAIDSTRTTAKKAAKQMRGRADEFVDQVRDRLPAAEDFIGRLADTTRRLVDERPATCLAAVGILGILIGMSIRPRR